MWWDVSVGGAWEPCADGLLWLRHKWMSLKNLATWEVFFLCVSCVSRILHVEWTPGGFQLSNGASLGREVFKACMVPDDFPAVSGYPRYPDYWESIPAHLHDSLMYWDSRTVGQQSSGAAGQRATRTSAGTDSLRRPEASQPSPSPSACRSGRSPVLFMLLPCGFNTRSIQATPVASARTHSMMGSSPSIQ